MRSLTLRNGRPTLLFKLALRYRPTRAMCRFIYRLYKWHSRRQMKKMASQSISVDVVDWKEKNVLSNLGTNSHDR